MAGRAFHAVQSGARMLRHWRQGIVTADQKDHVTADDPALDDLILPPSPKATFQKKTGKAWSG